MTSIWFSEPSLLALNDMRRETLVNTLGIEFTEIGADFVRARMPVTKKHHQPFGILHGGASVALAETLGSVAAGLVLDMTTHNPVGLEINANHIKSVRSGFVIGTTRALHIGRKTHVWEIKIRNDKRQLTCVSRLTVAILVRE